MTDAWNVGERVRRTAGANRSTPLRSGGFCADVSDGGFAMDLPADYLETGDEVVVHSARMSQSALRTKYRLGD